MTTFQKYVLAGLLATVAGAGFLAVRQNSQLQDQFQALQRQQTYLMQHVRQLEEAHLETKRQMAGLQGPLSPTTMAPAPARQNNAGTTAVAASRRAEMDADTNAVPSNQLEAELERGLAESTWGGREAALERLGRYISTNDLPRALAFLVQRAGLNGLETPLFDRLASRWGEIDPSAAVTWASSLQDTNAQQRALTKILSGWGEQHREAAVDYAAGLPAGDLQNAVIKQVVGDRTFRDAPGTAQWLAQHPQFADQVMGDLIFWGQGICPAAIADLMDQQFTLGRTNWLNEHGEQLASIWLNRDKAAARSWIEQAPLPEEIKQRLLKQEH